MILEPSGTLKQEHFEPISIIDRKFAACARGYVGIANIL